MAYQPSVVQYFTNRKRSANDDLKKNHSSKVLVMESHTETKNDLKNDTMSETSAKLVYMPKESLLQSGIHLSGAKKSAKKEASSKLNGIPKASKNNCNRTSQADLKTFLMQNNTTVVDSKLKETQNQNEDILNIAHQIHTTPKKKRNVTFLKMGLLSPTRNTYCNLASLENHTEEDVTLSCTPTNNKEEINRKQKNNGDTIVGIKSSKDNENKNIALRTNLLRKELNLGQIKKKLSCSSRLEEMKQAIERINEGKAKLLSIQEKLGVGPKKSTVEKVDLEMPYASPVKTPVKCPTRALSTFTPSRLFDEPPSTTVSSSPKSKSPYKSPAFQRYQSLVTEGRSALTLPFKFRALAEMFHCIDTVVSMFYNRKETTTFSKLKPAVEEMKKRMLTEYQLGQIFTIFPQGFEFSQEKIHKFGTTMQSDKYDLVIKPVLHGEYSSKINMMTPTCLLERKRAFYNTLLDMTKTYHEEFLKKLEPPLIIPRDRLTRWHPSFDIDGVPDIISSALPQPPNIEKITSAKDVLEKSRSLFTANPRLQNALQKVSESNNSPKNSISSCTPPPVSEALKGIPKCLLEKVRAKQAAKAMEAMTRTPAQAKEAVRLTRLPEIARIIRNLFVAEKKSVLPRDLVLKKVNDSYRENLTMSDLDDHIKLLAEQTPGWMMFCNIRKTDFIKLSKDADMIRIMKKLESLAAEKEF